MPSGVLISKKKNANEWVCSSKLSGAGGNLFKFDLPLRPLLTYTLKRAVEWKLATRTKNNKNNGIKVQKCV